MQNINNSYRGKSRAARFMQALLRIKVSLIVAFMLVAIVAAAYVVRSCRGNSISVYVNDDINITPAQITAMTEIGEWEFLSVEDEELIDTVRKGWFRNDELIRVYYGTLRLGFNMRDVGKDWIRVKNDTVRVTLPPVVLLDEDFIDEAKTKSFYESGTWNDKDRAALYRRARSLMRARCFTVDNIAAAERNAEMQFRNMLKAMGFERTDIKFGGKR